MSIYYINYIKNTIFIKIIFFSKLQKNLRLQKTWERLTPLSFFAGRLRVSSGSILINSFRVVGFKNKRKKKEHLYTFNDFRLSNEKRK